jgi:membrane-bound lytic murein transglycosylase A
MKPKLVKPHFKLTITIPFTMTITWVVMVSLLSTGCRRQKILPVQEAPEVQTTQLETWEPLAVRHHPHFGHPLSAWPSFKPHLERSLQHLQQRTKLPKHLSNPAMTKEDMIDLLKQLLEASSMGSHEFWHHLDERFVMLQAKSGQHEPAFFTGYYTPLYKGSKQKTATYKYPVYAPPSDLKQHPEKYSRAAIEKANALNGKALELCYLSSPLDVLLLHVQGSGTIELNDGTSLGLGYAGDNKKEYRSLGKMLVERGKIPAKTISLQSIQQYYKNYPNEVLDLIQLNERYIFFRFSDGQPRGSSGAIVEPFHSLATERFNDRTYRFPTHMPMLIHLNLPLHGKSTLPVLCQDTGSAIKGEARADIYLGKGHSAERVAGRLKHRGQMSMLWPKSLAFPKSIAGNPVTRGGMMPK